MADRVRVAVVGAGPFGLSVAAHVEGARVFGAPMRTWRECMPPDMLMRSAWDETSLSARAGGSIDEWAASVGESREEPLPLAKFLRYSDWFRERFVREHDPDDVVRVEAAGRDYRVTTESGAEVDARAVVVAVGVTPFPYAPPPLAEALGEGASFAIGCSDFESLRGKRVLVVGAGQAGLESAGLAAQVGADVEVLARSGIRWFADREPHHPRGPLQQRLYRLAYPAVGYGPPPINRLVLFPDLFAALPFRLRRRLTERLLRPGGSPWVRDLVEGKARVTTGTTVIGVERRGGDLVVRLADGSTREADAILVATGYRFALERLTMLDEGLRARIAVDRGWPVLDRCFRSTDPGILFVGYPAEGRFGPISRFVLGCEFSARRAALACS